MTPLLRLQAFVGMLGCVLLLGACEASDKVLFQSLAGEEPERPAPKDELLPAEHPPTLNKTYFRGPPITMPRAGDGSTSSKIDDLTDRFLQLRRDVQSRDTELQKIRAALSAKTEDYLAARRDMRRHLDHDKVERARIELDLIFFEIDRLTTLVAQITIDTKSLEKIVAATKQASQLRDATEADRIRYTQLKEQAEFVDVTLHKMLSEVHADISNQDDYANRQKDRLDRITARMGSGAYQEAKRLAGTDAGRKRGIESRQPAAGSGGSGGGGVSGGGGGPKATAQKPQSQPKKQKPAQNTGAPKPLASGSSGSGQTAAAPTGAPGDDGRKPLLSIQFGDPNVNYESQLFEAVSYVVERRPGVNFDVLAVAPLGSNSPESSAHVRGVLAKMFEMGVPADRVRVSAKVSDTVQSDEVHIFVR